jgi:hypothetical protein
MTVKVKMEIPAYSRAPAERCCMCRELFWHQLNPNPDQQINPSAE